MKHMAFQSLNYLGLIDCIHTIYIVHTFNLWDLRNFNIASGVQQDTKMQIANAQKI
jgi:hypothetical protein